MVGYSRNKMNRPLFEHYYNLIVEQYQEVIDLTNFKVKYSAEDKDKQQIRIAYQEIKEYIKNGSKGDLSLTNTPITQLPAGLKVRFSLYLNNTRITQLPADLKVGGDLYLSGTPMAEKYTEEQLKQMLPGVRGAIYI